MTPRLAKGLGSLGASLWFRPSLVAASHPRINVRILEVLTQLARLEGREPLRELQRVAVRIDTPTPAPIH